MTVYAVFYYDKPNGMWQLGNIHTTEKGAREEAEHYKQEYGYGYFLPRLLVKKGDKHERK